MTTNTTPALWRRITATAIGAGAIAVGAMAVGAPTAGASPQSDVTSACNFMGGTVIHETVDGVLYSVCCKKGAKVGESWCDGYINGKLTKSISWREDSPPPPIREVFPQVVDQGVSQPPPPKKPAGPAPVVVAPRG